jgi:hypothetical protein
MELVTSMWRQDRLRGLELATLAVAEQESPPSEATIGKLTIFARYGARIDKDIGRALQALRVLRDRLDQWIDELRERTSEPSEAEPQQEICTTETPSCTHEPNIREPHAEKCANDFTRARANPVLLVCGMEEGLHPSAEGWSAGSEIGANPGHEPDCQRDPAPHPQEPERLGGASPQTRMGPGWSQAGSRSSAWM